jgi:hypothetical protein
LTARYWQDYWEGRAIARAVRLQGLTAKTWVRAHVVERGVCGRQNGTGISFSQSSSIFRFQYHSVDTPYSVVHLEGVPKARQILSCKETQSRPIATITKRSLGVPREQELSGTVCGSMNIHGRDTNWSYRVNGKGKAVPLHAMETLGGRGGIAPTHSRPRHEMG